MGFESAPTAIEKACPSCKGDKVDSNGNKCKTCNGTGKAPKN